MTHAISYGARHFNWPSTQKASAMIFWRIYEAQKTQPKRRCCT